MKGPVIVFENPRSSDPGNDLIQALGLNCRHVTIDVLRGGDAEELKKKYVEEIAPVAPRNVKTGMYFDPPPRHGMVTYRVDGYVPTGKFHPMEKGRILYRLAFEVEISGDPRRDVEGALRMGCTKVSVAVNSEQSEAEKREQEESERRDEEERRAWVMWKKSSKNDGFRTP